MLRLFEMETRALNLDMQVQIEQQRHRQEESKCYSDYAQTYTTEGLFVDCVLLLICGCNIV